MKAIKYVYAALMVLMAQGASATGPVVLFDQGHGQRFVIEKQGDLNLYGLAGAMKDAGLDVKSTDKPFSSATLAGVACVITSGGFAPFSAEEIDALGEFVKDGGGLAVMLHIGPTYETLLKKFNIGATPGVIHETENVIGVNSLDFYVKEFAAHPLFKDVGSFAVHGAWGVFGLTADQVLVAETSKSAWIDLNRNQKRDPAGEPLSSIGVVAAEKVGAGRVVAFGDDAIFQDRFLEGGNKKLAENLALWLSGGK